MRQLLTILETAKTSIKSKQYTLASEKLQQVARELYFIGARTALQEKKAKKAVRNQSETAQSYPLPMMGIDEEMESNND